MTALRPLARARHAGRYGHLTHRVRVTERPGVFRALCGARFTGELVIEWSSDLLPVTCLRCLDAIRRGAA